jgi:hypothetical protein
MDVNPAAAGSGRGRSGYLCEQTAGGQNRTRSYYGH